MFKEVIEAQTKISTRRWLSIVGALAISTYIPGGGPLKDPFSASALVLPLLVLFVAVLFECWRLIIIRINLMCRDDGSSGWGIGVGVSILTWCLCVTAWHVANVPDPFTIKLLGSEGYIRTFAVYLFAIEAIKSDPSYRK
ncbi:hypothetical protein D3C76_878910 [compost metagenome]